VVVLLTICNNEFSFSIAPFFQSGTVFVYTDIRVINVTGINFSPADGFF